MRERFYILLKEHFINLESKLNQLDAVIGDGDHGSTLLKGLSAIPNSELAISNCGLASVNRQLELDNRTKS